MTRTPDRYLLRLRHRYQARTADRRTATCACGRAYDPTRQHGGCSATCREMNRHDASAHSTAPASPANP